MKKIKQLFPLIAAKVALGDSFKRFALVAICIMLSSTASAVTNYCGTTRNSTSPTTTSTLNYTCKKVSGTTYQMVLDFTNAVSSISNANIGSNPGPVTISATPVFTNSNKTLTYTFTSTSTPTLFVATIFVIISGTEVRWDLPLDANFATTCLTAPVLTTTAATNVANSTATMNGNISSNGGSSLTSYGFYYSTTNGFTPPGTGTQVVIATTDFTGNISSNLTGLTPGVTYYYKAYATNTTGTTYGTQQSFTTISPTSPPTVTTPTVTAISTTSATLGANITSIGGAPITARGTSYKTSSPVLATDNQLADGLTATGVYTQNRTGLSPETQYSYVGYATNANGTAISPEGIFRTFSNPATAAPGSFTATTGGPFSLSASWTTATFPGSGATKAGYVVIYATGGTPTLTSANGTAPAAGVGTLLNIVAPGNLPTLPAVTTGTISGLAGGTSYNLLLVPYTWDGTNAATYNYYTAGQLTTTGTSGALPAAPTPPNRVSTDVISAYSDAYTTSITGIVWQGNPGPTDITASGNNTKSATNTTFVQYASAPNNLSAMTFLHLDVYTTSTSATGLTITANNGNTTISTPNGSWLSFDIAVTPFGDMSANTILKFQANNPTAGTAGSFYFDNVYFYRLPAAPTITSFTPTFGCSGSTSVVITGANYTGASAVTVGGVAVSSFVVNSNTQITATVASGSSGVIGITGLGGSVNSVATFSNVPPTVPTATMASNNATTTLAKTGNVITVSFMTSVTPASTPTATIAGIAATVSGSGTSWTATRTVVGGDTNGAAAFSLSFQNAGGCTATRTTVTSGSAVTIDTVAPTIPTGTIASNNATTPLAKAGNTITLTFTTSEIPASTPVVTIAGTSAAVGGSGTSWTATKTVVGGDTNGVAAFSISISDAAGNTAVRTTTTNSSSVTIDTTAPTIPIATITSNNASPSLVKAGDTITLTFTTSETPASTPTVTINGTAATVSGSGTSWTATKTVVGGDTNGVAAFSISISDAAGNTTARITTTNSSSVTIDTAAPTIPIATIASNNASPSLAKAGDTITLTFTTSEAPASTPTVTINGAAATVSGSGTSWTATKTVVGGDTNGVVTFSISISDAAGNSASRTTTTNSSSVTIDTSAPTIPSVSIASNNANPTVAGTGDIITLSFTTSEAPASTPVVTIAGTSATVSGSGTSWTATKTVASCSGNLVTFSISISDAAGNASSRSTTTDGSQVSINPTPTATITSNNSPSCSGFSAYFGITGSNGATLNYTITGQAGTQQLLLNGGNQSITTPNATADVTLTLISVVNANCSSSTFATGTSTVTVNPLPAPPTISAGGSTTFCSSLNVVLTSSAATGYLWSNGETTQSITVSTGGNYSVRAINSFGCLGTSSAVTTVTVTPQPIWYLDADNDHYYTGAAVPSCTSPGAGYTTTGILGGGDCNDSDATINPGATEICYNNIDDNCDGTKSEGCAPVVVNMTPSTNNTTLTSFALAVSAVPYTYGSATNIKYRFSITNVTTGVTAPDIIDNTRFVSIPSNLRSYGNTYTIKSSAVINDEVLPFSGNTITVFGPSVQTVTLSAASCGATLSSLTASVTANPGLNATSYTFRIRLASDNGPTPTYGFSQSATRFITANSFTGFPLQYGTSYKVSVQFTFNDPVTNDVLVSGYGTECTLNTAAIPLIGLSSPTCGGPQLTSMNAGVSAFPANYATGYRFRIRLLADNGPTPTYYYTPFNASRFSSLGAFQGITLAYSTQYAISAEYTILNGATTVSSGFGAECTITTPFFPVTSLVPSQCGLATPTSLTQTLNITPYPGFPNYKVKLETPGVGEEVISEEKIFAGSTFKLSDFTIAQAGKTYSISVAIKLNGVFGDYSSSCDVFTAAAARTVKMPFKATAYPNPFANNFMIDVKTTSKSVVGIKVYDMIGRLIDQREVSVSDMDSTTIGDQYPSGVYNVVVSQEDSVQTVRVVKR